MNSIVKSFAVVAIAGFGIAFAPSADARSISAWSGAPQNHQKATCFTESYGTVTNACADQQTWIVPLVVEADGNWNVTVNVSTTSDPASVSCMVFGVTQDAGQYWSSPVLYADRASVAQNLPNLSAYVPGAGALYLGCFLKQGGRVNTVNWNQ